MVAVTSAEFQKNFGTYKKKALGEPVHITIHRKPTLVLISRERYEALVRQGKKATATNAAKQASQAPTPAAAVRPDPAAQARAKELAEKREIEHLNRVAQGASKSGIFFDEGKPGHS